VGESFWCRWNVKQLTPEGNSGGVFEDVDRFRIRIDEESIPLEYHEISISTKKGITEFYDDDSTKISLKQEFSGYPPISEGLVSKKIILVQDKVDNPKDSFGL